MTTLLKEESTRRRVTKSVFLGFVLMLVSTGLFGGNESVTYDRVNLSVHSYHEATNDTLSATMFKELEGSDPEQLSREVNKSVSDAVAFAKQHDEIEVQTLDYRTNPVYRNKVVSGWRVRQSIRLKSMNATALSAIIGQLQSQLNLGGISYTVSPERRSEIETMLIADGIKRFEERAELITKSLGRASYRLVRMDINTNASSPRPLQMHVMAAERAAPVLEAGTQPLEVTISGTIELKN